MAELLSACQFSAAMMLAASDAGNGCPPENMHVSGINCVYICVLGLTKINNVP